MNNYYWFMIASVVVAAFSQILLKVSAKKQYDSIIKEYLNPWVITGYSMMVLSTILTVLAFRGIEYKNGPIIESLGYILVLILSFVFFQEKITWKKTLGNVLILVGVIVFYI